MKKGFTLIELLVVVLIIGILAAVALPQYGRSIEKSRSSEVLTNMGAFINSSDRYFLANSEYPVKWEDLDISLPGGMSAGEFPNSWDNNFFQYRIHGAQSDQLGGIAIERLPYYEKYYLHYRVFNNGDKELQCIARDAKWEYLCLSMGGTYLSGKGTKNIRYKLR